MIFTPIEPEKMFNVQSDSNQQHSTSVLFMPHTLWYPHTYTNVPASYYRPTVFSPRMPSQAFRTATSIQSPTIMNARSVGIPSVHSATSVARGGFGAAGGAHGSASS